MNTEENKKFGCKFQAVLGVIHAHLKVAGHRAPCGPLVGMADLHMYAQFLSFLKSSISIEGVQ